MVMNCPLEVRYNIRWMTTQYDKTVNTKQNNSTIKEFVACMQSTRRNQQSQNRSGSGFRSTSQLLQIAFRRDTRDRDGSVLGALAAWRDGMRGRGRLLSLEERGSAVYAHREVIVSFAGFKGAGVVISGHVPLASEDVVDVLAVAGSIGASACAEAELGGGHKIGPLVILLVSTERVSEDQSSNGVTVTVSTVRIEFTALVALGNVHRSEVTNTSNLDVINGFDEMHAFKRAIGDRARSAAGLGAPRDLVLLGVADSVSSGARRSPEAEIVIIVDPGGLALGRLRRGGTALVRTGLSLLGGRGEVVDVITDVPYLVGVPAATGPDLNAVSVGEGAAGEIRAFTVVRPGETVVAGVVPVLVCVVVGRTVPDLEFGAVLVGASGDVETFGSEDFDGS